MAKTKEIECEELAVNDPQEIPLDSAKNDQMDKSLIYVTKEAEYELKFADRYKDSNFQSKENIPQPFIWINMPTQNRKYDRNRSRDYQRKRQNNDGYLNRDREYRGRY